MVLNETFEVLATATVIIGGGVAAFQAIHEMRENRGQRQEELEWRRASAARELLEEIHEHPHASSAVMMMDWSSGDHGYDTGSGRPVRISYKEALETLERPMAECRDLKEAFIRDSFDWFLYYVDRIEHYIRTKYIGFEDVRSVFVPYARRVNEDRALYDRFMDERHYLLAKAFFDRYVVAPRSRGRAAATATAARARARAFVVKRHRG